MIQNSMEKYLKVIAGVLTSLLLLSGWAQAQDIFFTKNGRISFYSKAPLENIEAIHKSVTCVLDSRSGDLQLTLLLRGFEFEKALMQEHFNENYMESDKYPKAQFKGQLLNNSEVNYTKDGTYNARVKGWLSFHGETKELETSGKILVKGGKVTANAVFTVLTDDYNISIPGVVRDKVAKNIQVTVDCAMEPLRNQNLIPH